MRPLLAFCAGLLSTGIVFAAQPTLFPVPLSPRIANYAIDVRYDSASHRFEGREILTWRNSSTTTVPALQFHLYLNAFRNTLSTFMKESERAARGMSIDTNGWGFINIRKIRIVNGGDLTASLRFIQPDDGNADDRTVCELTLPRPLGPGDSIALSIDFNAKLPAPPIARSGAKAEYAFAGQWFPKIGVYTDRGWNCHQYHANTEFFADFGVYDVNITVPASNTVGATGIETGITQNGDGTSTHRYHAEDVHDFAWTTSPEYVVFNGTQGHVAIRVLMQPDHRGQADRYLRATQVAIDHFERWYGPYPYPNVTVVDPRRGAGGTGGMEYPTLFTAGTDYVTPDGVRLPEIVVIHEFGHNYWYGMLASNEFEESWLDEGINTYTEIQIMEDAYGASDMLDYLGLHFSDLAFARIGYLPNATYDPTVKKGWEYYNGSSYGSNSYSKPGVFLTTLHYYLGRETMMKIMRAYVERWSFRHPTSKDFIAVANDVSGKNLDWFFDQALSTNNVLDYSVDFVRSDRVRSPAGVDYTLKNADSLAAPSSDNTPGDTASLYRTDVKVRRLGTFTFPVTVEMVFADGSKIREQWDGKDFWQRYRYIRPSRLVSATVDPDHVIPLDINLANNSKTIEEQPAGAWRTASGIVYWFQAILDQPELMNFVTFFQSLF